jgi:hypothetical protein
MDLQPISQCELLAVEGGWDGVDQETANGAITGLVVGGVIGGPLGSVLGAGFGASVGFFYGAYQDMKAHQEKSHYF